MNARRLLPLAAGMASLLLVACGETRTWDPANPPVVESAGKRVVLVAPVDPGPVANIYPAATGEMARAIARSVDTRVDDAQAWYGATLPSSSDPTWNAGPVGAANGAHIVILAQVTDLVTDPPSAMNPVITATLTLRALNHRGAQVFSKTAVGRSVLNPGPKATLDPAGQPEARAANNALRSANDAFIAWMKLLPSEPIVPASEEQPVEAAPLVDVIVDSIPPNADIYVDGFFRGTTPATVPLPVRELRLRVQRQGFQPWEAFMTPSSGQRVAPALEPLGAAPEATPAP